MTPKQAKQFNSMLAALKIITNGYQTSTQLRKNAEKQYGLDFEEVIEMAYDNMQGVARQACKGISPIPSSLPSQG